VAGRGNAVRRQAAVARSLAQRRASWQQIRFHPDGGAGSPPFARGHCVARGRRGAGIRLAGTAPSPAGYGIHQRPGAHHHDPVRRRSLFQRVRQRGAPRQAHFRFARPGRCRRSGRCDRFFAEDIMSDFRIEDGRVIFCPQGDIVASVADGLRARVRDLMQEHPGPLVMDLGQVELIDSVGIGLLIAVHNSLAKSGQRLALTKVNADLAGLLRTMRLDKHFSIETV